MVGSSEESPRRTASRRRVLQVCGGLAAGGLAGCSQSSSDPATAPATDSPTATATETPTPTASPSPTPIQQPYRVDLQPANEANAEMAMFQYSTGRGWDDMVVDLDRLDEWHENDWTEFSKDKFQDFLTALETDGITGGDAYLPYPNGGDGNGWGNYLSDKWLDATSFEKSMEWWMPAYLEYQQNNVDGVNSTDQYEMAPALERSYEQLKDWEVHAWAFNAPTTDGPGNHGQVLARDHQGQLWKVDTTSTSHERTQAKDWADSFWHPLRYRGKAPDVDRVDYAKAKNRATGMLLSMASQDLEVPEENAIRKSAITDQYLTSALTVMRDDGRLPDRILHQMQVTNKLDVENYETNWTDLLYGTIDDPRYVVGPRPDLADLVEAINTTEQTYTIDDVESRLDVGT